MPGSIWRTGARGCSLALMDTGLIIIIGLLTTAATIKVATDGNPIPGYLLSLLAAMGAFYAMQEEMVRSQVMLAWTVCALAIASAYVGQQVKRSKGG